MNRRSFIAALHGKYGMPKAKASELWDMVMEYTDESAPFSKRKVKGAVRTLVNNLADDITMRFIDYFKTLPGGVGVKIGKLRSKTKKCMIVVLSEIASEALKDM